MSNPHEREINAESLAKLARSRRAVDRLLSPMPISWPEVEEEFPQLSREEAARHLAGRLPDRDKRLLYEALFALHPGLESALEESRFGWIELDSQAVPEEPDVTPASAAAGMSADATRSDTPLATSLSDENTAETAPQRWVVPMDPGDGPTLELIVQRAEEGTVQVRMPREWPISPRESVHVLLNSGDGAALWSASYAPGGSQVLKSDRKVRPLSKEDVLVVEHRNERGEVTRSIVQLLQEKP